MSLQRGFFIRKYKVRIEEQRAGKAGPSEDKEDFDDLIEPQTPIGGLVYENEGSPPMSTFTTGGETTDTPEEKKPVPEDMEDLKLETDKGEPDWGGLDELMADLNIKAGRDVGSGPVVEPPAVKPTGMDYADVEEDAAASTPEVKTPVKPTGMDYDDIEDDEETGLLSKDEPASPVNVEADNIPDYAKIDKSRKTSQKEPLLVESENSEENTIPDYAVVDKSKKTDKS
jgi:hypothetical protein